jgi:hypothetical protein
LKGLKEPNTRKPAGHWQIEDAVNVRTQLDQFAKKRGLDPLLPETWYKIPSAELFQEVYPSLTLFAFSRPLSTSP